MVKLSRVAWAASPRSWLVVTLALAFGLQASPQDVSPRLLEAAREAYQQQQQRQPEILTPAQVQPQVPPISETDWNNLRQLRVGARIAVKTKDNIRHSGEFLAYSEEAISLRKGKREVGYRRQEVVRVLLLGAPKRSKGAKIGFLVGCAVAAGIAAAKIVAVKEDPSSAIILVPIGALGGGIGAAIGAAVTPRSKSVVYRAP